MTVLHFNCPPTSGNPLARPLVFSWDHEAGTVTGPDADQVRALAQPGIVILAHPLPWTVTLGEAPLRSWRDMAAVVGTAWRVPPELAPHYPRPAGADSDGLVRDLEGNVVGRVTF